MNEFEKLLNTSYSDLKDPRMKKVTLDSRIDEESKTFIDTFNAALERLFEPVMSRSLDTSLDYTKSIKEYDFSALVNSLAKVFEREMNNSIVQWFRLKEGIEMPDYYNKVKYNEKGKEVPVTIVKIDLNNGTEKVLFTIPIGNILHLIKSSMGDMIKHREIKEIKEISGLFNEYSDLLKRLKYDRNAASHTQVMDEKSFLEFYKSYCNLVDKGWFTVLMNLKDKMKGVIP